VAKSSKTARTERQALIEKMRAEQKAADRRRGMVIVVICVVVGVLIVGLAAFKPIKDALSTHEYSNKPLTEIGAPASACQKVTTKPATGNQEHVANGSPISYTDSPPAFGKHYIDPDPMGRKFYTAQDRPMLGTLVHNLEHGYTIAWYDASVAKSSTQMNQLRAVADKFSGTTDLRDKFKAVPWTSADGQPFPDGEHVAYTHWSVGGAEAATAGQTKQVGVWQYCSALSGAALQKFVIDYPYTDSPEPTSP
jgi:hypothetical protein